MTPVFAIIAFVTLAAAVAAMTLRNLVHCVLSLVVVFAGLAAAFLNLDAQFAGFAQILVYVGAVAILIVFTVLLTRAGWAGGEAVFSKSPLAGVVVAALLFAVIAGCILRSGFATRMQPVEETAATPAREIGNQLMTQWVLPLEAVGLLLTTALIGAVVLAMNDRESKERP
jgi:NADH-quinone oxidoreductase subunit J